MTLTFLVLQFLIYQMGNKYLSSLVISNTLIVKTQVYEIHIEKRLEEERKNVKNGCLFFLFLCSALSTFYYKQALYFNRKIMIYKSTPFLFKITWVIIVSIEFPFPLLHTIYPFLFLF